MPQSNVQAQLELQNKKLDWVLQLTQAINYNFSKSALLDIYDHILSQGLKIEQYLFYLFEDEWGIAKSKTNDNQNYKQQIPSKFLSLEKITQINETNFEKFNWLVPIFHKNQPLAYILLGGLNWENEIEEQKKLLKYIQSLSNIVIVANENKRMFRQKMQQEIIQHDLDLATQIQEALIPKQLPNTSQLQLSAIYKPNREVGGDYYDCLPINEKEYIFAIADVSGKGVSAALIMANFQANLRTLIYEKTKLETLIPKLNRNFFDYTKGDTFITLFIGKLNIETGELFYITAGHVPPILYSKGEIQRLNQGTTMLGAFEELPFLNLGFVQLDAPSTLVAFTDGVNEVINFRNEEYKVERLIEFTEKHQNENLNDFNGKLLQSMIDFKGGSDFRDDISILSLKFEPKN